VAKFAAAGKRSRKKDLGMMAAAYGSCFVGQISLGANPMHAIKTILKAEAYRGPSLIIAYSHCIGHGINMIDGLNIQKEAVTCGYWPLYHYDPRDAQTPFHLDSRAPKGNFREFAMKAARFAILARSKPEEHERLMKLGEEDIRARWQLYEQLAQFQRLPAPGNGNGAKTETSDKATT